MSTKLPLHTPHLFDVDCKLRAHVSQKVWPHPTIKNCGVLGPRQMGHSLSLAAWSAANAWNELLIVDQGTRSAIFRCTVSSYNATRSSYFVLREPGVASTDLRRSSLNFARTMKVLSSSGRCAVVGEIVMASALRMAAPRQPFL